MGEERNREIYEWSSASSGTPLGIKRDYLVASRRVSDTVQLFYVIVCICTFEDRRAFTFGVAGSLAGLSCLFLTGTLSTTVFFFFLVVAFLLQGNTDSSPLVCAVKFKFSPHGHETAIKVILLGCRHSYKLQIKQSFSLEATSQQISS